MSRTAQRWLRKTLQGCRKSTITIGGGGTAITGVTTITGVTIIIGVTAIIGGITIGIGDITAIGGTTAGTTTDPYTGLVIIARKVAGARQPPFLFVAV